MSFRDTGAAGPSAVTGLDQGEAPRHPVRCAACRADVTSREAAIAVDGRHAHRCTNPHGFVFDIGCYAEAPGLVAVGEPEGAFSWFPGAAWQIGRCARCQTHLGWRFVGRERAFVALVLDRIIDVV